QASVVVNLNDINEPPSISNQSFSLDENSANGSTVGTVLATDPDNGQTLSYSIDAGNTDNAFAINATSGILTVNNAAVLNFEQTSSFTLTICVADNGSGSLSSQASVVVNLNDINEPPSISNQSFSLDENSANGTNVGSVAATDPDIGQSISFSIMSGNPNGAFTINSSTGLLSVTNSAEIDFELNPVFNLIIEVTDDGTTVLSSQAGVQVILNDLNETPNIEDQSFALAENTAQGSSVGTVLAVDPDAGQNLLYQILSGNTDNAFVINASTGIVMINNESAINYESNPVFMLTVKVTDNGVGNLSDQAVVTIALIDINEAPVILTESLFVTVDGNLISHEINGNRILVGFIDAFDPDAGQTLSYEITSGNHPEIWDIEWETGELSITNPYYFNPIELHNYPLYIKVSDNASQSLNSIDEIVIEVNIQDVNAYVENVQNYTSLQPSAMTEEVYKLYPNPASDNMKIEMEGIGSGKFILGIFNLSGEEVLRKEFGEVSGGLSSDIDISMLSKGIYMVNFQLGKMSHIKKLVKL
ncbi:MAG: cadherin domain-containing protein, partial [Bacteroidales bacterium]|nr:cadherin domain-containing protein [Bacteroidales bacterium]